jgi:acetoin utilization protein AcuB
MLVRELMSRSLVSVRPDDSVTKALDCLRAHQIHHLLVLDGTTVVGVVSMRDLAGKSGSMRVEELMVREVSSIDADATLRRAASMMIRSTTGCLPVTENGTLAGIITTTDLMKVLNADATLT